jgi:hypothetical protein
MVTGDSNCAAAISPTSRAVRGDVPSPNVARGLAAADWHCAWAATSRAYFWRLRGAPAAAVAFFLRPLWGVGVRALPPRPRRDPARPMAAPRAQPKVSAQHFPTRRRVQGSAITALARQEATDRLRTPPRASHATGRNLIFMILLRFCPHMHGAAGRRTSRASQPPITSVTCQSGNRERRSSAAAVGSRPAAAGRPR